MMIKALDSLFPGPWILSSSVLSYLVLLSFGVFLGHLGPADGMPLAGPLTWALSAALAWWGLLGPRLCNLACTMIALRLPGVRRTLLRGIVAHLTLSVGPPLLYLLLWPPANQDVLQLAAAVWLGSCFALLALSTPLALSIIPSALLGLFWSVLAEPGLSAMLGVLALVLTSGLWHWHAKRPRSELLTPLGAVLDGATLGVVGPLKERLAAPQRLNTPNALPGSLYQDRIATLLGYQTIRQAHGVRRQYLSYLVMIGFAVVAYALQPTYSGPFLSMWVAVLLIWIPLRSIGRLIDLHDKGRATLAELLLMPGLPARDQLQASVMRQLRNCLLEKQILMTLIILAMGALNEDPGLHQPLPAIAFSAMMVVASLGLAKLAWRGALSRRQLGAGTIAAMLSVFVGTTAMNMA
ncbi:hypothetical protein [Pseudomonas alkylphenolica]|uniref:hypothetical protein n=1 Tax=Pseudomonas alkylphenolica TaxID=237609 RepID=UPI0018D6E3F4|nr:hypothetical protein [Pseudomonas alkylphenolica]MBH3428185.1 hypothetical protein [Pseudomonas alkylphenolica]